MKRVSPPDLNRKTGRQEDPRAEWIGALALTFLSSCLPVDPPPPAGPAQAPADARSAGPKPLPRTEALATARVYDDKGAAAACGPPGAGCAPLPASNDFIDHCRLAGFRVLQCGCEARCTGDAVAASRHYDASGQPKECAKSLADCTPPQAAGAFQDACNEHGFRLDVCGCEWLCSGDFKH